MLITSPIKGANLLTKINSRKILSSDLFTKINTHEKKPISYFKKQRIVRDLDIVIMQFKYH